MVGNNFEAFASVVNISGGTVGEDTDAFAHSQFNISGGTVGNNFDAHEMSQINISGGSLGRIDAYESSNIDMTGGYLSSFNTRGSAMITMVGGNIGSGDIDDGSQMIWNGGTITNIYAREASLGTSLTVSGFKFQNNGINIPGLNNPGDSIQFNLEDPSSLTATLADGSPLALNTFNYFSNADIEDGTLTLIRSADPTPKTPSILDINSENAPFSIGLGQTLNLISGGILPDNFIAGGGSTLNILDGIIGSGLQTFRSKVNISGGTIEDDFAALAGAKLDISGGIFNGDFKLFNASRATIRGGDLPELVRIEAGSIVDIYGTSFLLDGRPIYNLSSPGDSILLTKRSGYILSAILQDGSELRWKMSDFRSRYEYGISSNAFMFLHLTSIPEPSTTVLLVTGIIACISTRRRSH